MKTILGISIAILVVFLTLYTLGQHNNIDQKHIVVDPSCAKGFPTGARKEVWDDYLTRCDRN